MLQPRITSRLQKAIFNSSSICIRCQNCTSLSPSLYASSNRSRTFATASTLRFPANDPKTPKEPRSQEQAPATQDEEPEATFVPQLLGRPIGFPTPPKAGENLGLRVKKTYTGTLKEKNLEKRKDIVESWGQNYFRDFKNIRKYRSGKTFLANPRIFRKDVSLYFPNLHGETLAESKADTTPVLNGKISVVSLYSSHWGETQARTFTGKKENAELHEIVKQEKDVAQVVDLNVEENTMKAWIVAFFRWRLRRQRAKEDWGKYFVIRRGVTQRIRETIGALNGRVGYVYLVDENCKIRWAGSADAESEERESLTKGLKKLVQEARDKKYGSTKSRIRSPRQAANEELEAQAVNAGAS